MHDAPPHHNVVLARVMAAWRRPYLPLVRQVRPRQQQAATAEAEAAVSTAGV